MTRSVGRLVGACALCLGVSASAGASSILFDNGTGGNPCTNTTDACVATAWNIGGGSGDFAVSDTFTLASDDTITGVELWAWLLPGDTLDAIDWSIGPSAFSTLYADTGAPSSTFATDSHDMYDVYDVTFSLSLPLSAGTYWLTLANATATGGAFGASMNHPVFWDQDDGPSTGQQNSLSLAGCDLGQSTTCSESFQILGTDGNGGQVPEPASMILLGTGLAAGGVRRLRRKTNRS